jgi:hypothetical protein
MMSLTGKWRTADKTLIMLDHYAGHKIAGDRERLREAQIETFGGLLPEAVREGA